MMNCNHDGTTMQRVAYTLTSDQKQILSTFMCPKCLSRKTDRQENPRYSPIVREYDKVKEDQRKQKQQQGRVAWDEYQQRLSERSGL